MIIRKIIENFQRNYYEDRLGFFIEDIHPSIALCKLFGIYPISDIKKRDVQTVKKYVLIFRTFFSLMLKSIIHIICSLYNINSLPKMFSLLEKVLVLLFITDKIVQSINGSSKILDFINRMNDFDNHCKTLKPKCTLNKFKYYRHLWIIFGLFSIINLIIMTVGDTFNSDLTVLEMLTIIFGYDILVGLIYFQGVFHLLLYNEINIRMDLLKNSLSKRFQELITAKCNVVLIALNFDKYRYIQDKLAVITNDLNDTFGTECFYLSTIYFVLFSWIFYFWMELSARVSTLGFCFRCFIPTCYLISSHNYATKVSKNVSNL